MAEGVEGHGTEEVRAALECPPAASFAMLPAAEEQQPFGEIVTPGAKYHRPASGRLAPFR